MSNNRLHPVDDILCIAIQNIIYKEFINNMEKLRAMLFAKKADYKII